MANPFKNMPVAKPKPPVILAVQQPASIAPATVTSTALPKMPQAKAKQAAPEVVVAAPAPVRMETLAEFKQRQIKESVEATAAAAAADRRAKMLRDFGSRPAVNAAPTALTDDELAAIEEERATAEQVAKVYSQEHEEVEREVVVAEASEPVAPKRDSFKVTLEPLPLPKNASGDTTPRVVFPPRPLVLELYYDDSNLLRLARDGRLLTSEEVARLPEAYRAYAVADKYRKFLLYLTSDQPLEVFYDEDGRMRVVADGGIVGAGGRVLTAEEVRMIPCRTNNEREVQSLQRDLLGTPVRELEARRIPMPSMRDMTPSKSTFGHPPPRRFLPPSATAPSSSGLMSSRVGVLPPAEGRPPMPPIRPRSKSNTGRDE